MIKRKDEQEPGGKLEAQEQGGMPVIEGEGDLKQTKGSYF